MNQLVHMWFADIALMISGATIAECFALRMEYLRELK
jgi:hypothetical protein